MKPKRLTVEDIIHKAIAAQRIASEQQAHDTFRMTEKRLYAYPVIKLKIAADRERIEDMRQDGAPGMSKSVIRYQKPGVRLTPDEIAETIIEGMLADIARNEHEFEAIEKALGIIRGDSYEDIIKYKYFENKNDEEIAELMVCNASTIKRNKSRLVGRLAVFLYGVAAV